MATEIIISPKDLGALAMDDFCPRCFWIKRKAPKGLPFQIFPGIFSSIDAYSKNIVHAYLDRHHSLPGWMPGNFDGVCGYLKAPHWSKFKWTDPVTGITMRGVVDDLLINEVGEHFIPDYKTAKFTANADRLLPIYETQLNAYEIIDRNMGGNVKGLALVYCEPVTGPEACAESVYYAQGFDMAFTAHVHPVEINPQMVMDLLVKAADILESEIPAGADDCKDCIKLDSILDLVA